MDGDLEVLLVTTRETGRWVIPKGWPMIGKTPRAAAAREALEEAGVVGKPGRRRLGAYNYPKLLKSGATVVCRVTVFPLAVIEQKATWREQTSARPAGSPPPRPPRRCRSPVCRRSSATSARIGESGGETRWLSEERWRTARYRS